MPPLTPEQIAACTVAALYQYDRARLDPITAPAAFGFACAILRKSLDVDLKAAALVLESALREREKRT